MANLLQRSESWVTAQILRVFLMQAEGQKRQEAFAGELTVGTP